MASARTNFSSALFYALKYVGKPGLVLKDKQVEVLKYLPVGATFFSTQGQLKGTMMSSSVGRQWETQRYRNSVGEGG